MRCLQTSLKTESQPDYQRDVVGVACKRAREGSEIAARIIDSVSRRVEERSLAGRFAGLCLDEATALASADKLAKCADCENVWHGEDLMDEFGELFEGINVLWGCNGKLCPSCMAANRKRAKKNAREGMARARPLKAERWFFITLTMPTLPASQVSLIQTMRVMYDSWRAMTQHGEWKDKISRATIKAVEFTLGDEKKRQEQGREWSPDVDGYHVHFHLLVLRTEFVNVRELREMWSRCLRDSWRLHGIEQGINTSDGLAVCNVKLVTSRKVKTQNNLISYEGALCEVAKYITKAESFLRIPESQLIDVAGVRRFPRMFEVLGDCSNRAKANQTEHTADEAAKRYVHTDGFSAGEISAGEKQRNGMLRASRPRNLPLKQRGIAFLLDGKREEWLECLSGCVVESRNYRREQLAERYPCATFRTLAGGKWYGMGASPVAKYLRNHAAEVETGGVVELREFDAANAAKNRWEWRIAVGNAENERWQRWVNDGEDNEQRAGRFEQWRIFKQNVRP